MTPDAETIPATPSHALPSARPLRPSAKFLLILGASAAILLGYVFSAVAMALLLVLILLELLVGICLARFGMLGVISPVIRSHGELLRLFGSSLWLREGERCRVPIDRTDAPRLFAMLDALAGRLAINVPREVVVEMNVGAWVELRGWRQGSRATRLGLGYDLLAGLTEAETEAVLAHEMAHAKLVRRGLKRWLNRGLARLATLSNALSDRKDALRRVQKVCSAGDAALSAADPCTRLAARFVAAYSRQDEFEADRGAAELCGAAPLRSALGKLRGLSERTDRLGWHERVAKLQQGEGYAAWLRAEIQSGAASSDSATGHEIATDPYSSHPSIPDRLAALPDDGAPTPVASGTADACALDLIQAPDRLADRLVSAIETFSAKLEARDDHQLRGLARKIRSGAEVRPLQWLAILFFVGGLAGLPLSLADGFSPILLALSLLALGGGVWLYRAGRTRTGPEFPVPSFSTIRAGLDRIAEYPDLGAEEKRLEKEIQEAIPPPARRKERVASLHARAFAALARGDFLEAHVAARLGLGADNKSLPCALAFVVAAGSIRQDDMLGKNLRFIRARSALRSPDILWACAWALFLNHDWLTAEALLLDLVKARPGDVTVRLLLASCASHRGKRQTALTRAREAVALAPADPDTHQMLLGLLLDGGYVREARERVSTLPPAILDRPDFRLHRVRLHLLCGEADDVRTLEESILAAAADDAPLRIRLAAAHESVRRHERAHDLYEEAVRLGHYPEARLGLGRLAGLRGDTETARRHFFSTLDTQTKLGPKSEPPLSFFGHVLGGLAGLRGAPRPCRAWIATFTGNALAGPLANKSFLIFASDDAEARADMLAIASAILPQNTLQNTHVVFRPAPAERQPAGAVLPGVQGVWE